MNGDLAAVLVTGGAGFIGSHTWLELAPVGVAAEVAWNPDKACGEADLVMQPTEWPVYRELDPAALRGVVRTPRVLDAHNAPDMEHRHASGLMVRNMGRPASSPVSRAAWRDP